VNLDPLILALILFPRSSLTPITVGVGEFKGDCMYCDMSTVVELPALAPLMVIGDKVAGPAATTDTSICDVTVLPAAFNSITPVVLGVEPD
jgi:hypothetical protein